MKENYLKISNVSKKYAINLYARNSFSLKYTTKLLTNYAKSANKQSKMILSVVK